MVCSWNDNSAVTVASNIYSVEPAQNVSRWSKKEKKIKTMKQPLLINKYNKYMGGVDRADQNISLYRCSIRGKKWYSPLILHCIDLVDQNAWQLHCYNGGKLDHLAFRRRVAVNLLETYGKKFQPRISHSLPSHDSRFDRLDHLMTEVPRVDGKPKQLTCRQCHKKTTTKCSKCDKPLHVKCNMEFHTRK